VNNIKAKVREMTDDLADQIGRSLIQTFANTPKAAGDVY